SPLAIRDRGCCGARAADSAVAPRRGPGTKTDPRGFDSSRARAGRLRPRRDRLAAAPATDGVHPEAPCRRRPSNARSSRRPPAPAFIPCDLRDIPALKSAIAEARTQLGAIRVLVNNAAHDERHTIERVTPEYWDDRFAVNVRHQFFAAQAVAPEMASAGGGSIINFGSTSWLVGQGGMPAYLSAKAAVAGLTRALARDLGPMNIRVNS